MASSSRVHESRDTEIGFPSDRSQNEYNYADHSAPEDCMLGQAGEEKQWSTLSSGPNAGRPRHVDLCTCSHSDCLKASRGYPMWNATANAVTM